MKLLDRYLLNELVGPFLFGVGVVLMLFEGSVIFRALKERCRVENGYTVLKDVATGEKGDLMPSYFLAETLKYLYLLFSPEEKVDVKSANVVFNTEAHPLKRTW